MNNQSIKEISSKKIQEHSLYQQIKLICTQLSEKYQIPEEWIFIYLGSKNWNQQQLQADILENKVILPDSGQSSKIFIGKTNIHCELCGQIKQTILRNLCQHYFCFKCLLDYILGFYLCKDVKRTLLPLCIFYEECSQMISIEIIEQILYQKQNILRKIKRNISIDYQNAKKNNKISKKDKLTKRFQ